MTKDKLILKLRANKRARQIAANRLAMLGEEFADMIDVSLCHHYIGQLRIQVAMDKIYSDMADELILKRKG